MIKFPLYHLSEPKKLQTEADLTFICHVNLNNSCFENILIVKMLFCFVFSENFDQTQESSSWHYWQDSLSHHKMLIWTCVLTCRHWWYQLQSSPRSSQQSDSSPRHQPLPLPSGWSLEAPRGPQLHTHTHTKQITRVQTGVVTCNLAKTTIKTMAYLMGEECRSFSLTDVAAPRRCPRESWWQRGPWPS